MYSKLNFSFCNFLFLFLFLTVISCKKKNDSSTETSCDPVNNKNPVSITGFDRPVAIAFSSTGKVVVTENRSYDSDLNPITSAPAPVFVFSSADSMMNHNALVTISGIVGPEAAVFDNKNNLYITETEVQSGISIYRPPYTSKLKTIHPGWSNPRGIAVDTAGNLYVAIDYDNKIVKITDPLGTETISDFITGLNHPKALDIAENKLFVAEYDGNKVSRYDLADGQLVDDFTVTQPIDLTVKGCLLYVTLHNGNANGNSSVIALKAYHFGGGIQKEYTGFTGAAFGLCHDKNGDLYVADFKNGLFKKFLK